jgi:hypothetical protein
MEAGAFNDEEARGVKDLNDLGGGRIFDTVQKLAVKILDHHEKK